MLAMERNQWLVDQRDSVVHMQSQGRIVALDLGVIGSLPKAVRLQSIVMNKGGNDYVVVPFLCSSVAAPST
jgi:hypothetical protein